MKLGQNNYLTPEVVTLIKFHEDRTKIVDFFLILTFLASPLFYLSPSRIICTYVEQLVVSGVEVGNVLIGHPVNAVNPEFGQTDRAVT